MFKSYHKKIITTTLITATVLLGTACNASSEDERVAKVPTAVVAPKAVEAPKAPTAPKAIESKKAVSNTDAKIDNGPNPAVAKTSDTVKKHYDFNKKLIVDGGVYYPIVNGKTGAYYANEKAHTSHVTYGKPATANEQAMWDIDIMADGHGLPEGSGSVEDGDEIYEEKCASCHGDFGAGDGLYPSFAKGNAYEGQKTLTNQRIDGQEDGPIRNFGAYWPYASTAWWYIKTGMPHQAPMSLKDDEVYALVAYLLYINEIEVDGVLVEDEYVLDREKFKKIVMPNVDGFEPKINGPKGQDNARAYFNNTANYGNGSRCMKDCIDGEPKVQKIARVIEDFEPALSSVRDLPAPSADAKPSHPGKAGYDKSCAICHATDSMGAPDVGNAKAWKKLLEQGKDTIYNNAINGKGGMPPKGGAMSLSEDKIKEIVDYMLEESK